MSGNVISNYDSTSDLNSRKIELEAQIEESSKISMKRKIYGIVWIVLLLGSIAGMLYEETRQKFFWVLLVAFIVSGIGAMYISSMKNTDSKNQLAYLQELSAVNDKLFTNEIASLSQEERAVKQLTKSQSDLDRYYQLNYGHINKIFNLGKTIIYFGSFIILFTLGLVFIFPKQMNSVVVISGFVGGTLVDFTGAIFVMMYSKIIKSADMNQYGMLETSQAYLGNVLASQITDDKLREQTFSELAKKLIEKEKAINYNND